MRRKSVKKSSMFKLQAEKNMYQKYLNCIPLCQTVFQYPDFEDVLVQVSRTVNKYCYSFGEESPFQKGLNYGGRNFGFSTPLSNTIVYKEWIPNAKQAYLMGQFNKFDEFSHKLSPVEGQQGFYQIELDIEETKIKNQQRVLLKIVDNHGEVYKIAPPSCRVRDSEGFGILSMEISVPISKGEKKKQGLSGFILDLSQIKIQNSLAFINQNTEISEYFDTIILKNLFKSECLSERYNLLSDDVKYLREIIDKVKNQMGMKIVLEWNLWSGKKKQTTNPLEQAFFIKSEINEEQWHYNLQKQQVFSFCLANLSFYSSVLQFDGFYFKNMERLDRKVQIQTFIRCANILNQRIHEHGITIASSSTSKIPGFCQGILDGGLGFTFSMINQKQGGQDLGNAKIIDKIVEKNKQIEKNSNILWINLRSGTVQMSNMFKILSSDKGFMINGIPHHNLSKALKSRKQTSELNGKLNIEKIQGNSFAGCKKNYWIILNFDDTEQKFELEGQGKLMMLSHWTDSSKQPIIESRSISLQGKGYAIVGMQEIQE